MEHNNVVSAANVRSSATATSSSAAAAVTATTTPATNESPARSSSEQVSHKTHEQLQRQHQQHQHLHAPQQAGNDHQQQFCLRWHNHQTSLLSTLPILLDQSHLTDVTISAEGRTLRAHRVVLSACSSFFLEIFRTLDNTHHPVIIIPGASFQAIVSLLTFMYSGEVNVYEEQIPTLLSLAETLGIKGLADVHNNLQKTQQKPPLEKDSEEPEKSMTPPTPPPSAMTQTTSSNFTIPQAPVQPPALVTPMTTSTFNPLLNPALSSKYPSPLENFFLKSLQFYPNLMHQPLNFSQTALNKTSEWLAKYQHQCNLYQANLAMNSKDLLPLLHPEEGSPRSILTDDLHATKRFCTGLEKKPSSSSSPQRCGPSPLALQSQRDIKRIDKIVENLRGSSAGGTTSGNVKHMGSTDNNGHSPLPTHLQNQLSPLTIKTSMENYVATSSASPLASAKSNLFSSPTSVQPSSPLHSQLGFNISAEDQLKLQQHLDKYAASCAAAAAAAAGNITDMESIKQEPRSGNDKTGGSTPQSPQNKTPSSSKLYATCFICHKQLSNQYNLRVHLETHQNVRYACNVCSHVSRSKDALRKHVSYRHPGAPSPCETEARRKRANKLLASSINASAAAAAAVAAAASSSSSGELTPTSPNNVAALNQPFQITSADRSCGSDATHPQLSAAHLNSAYQMFLPNQFHLAAAAASAAAQQHYRESPSASPKNTISNNNSMNSTALTAPSLSITAAKTSDAPGSIQNNSNINAISLLGEEGKTTTSTTTTITPDTNINNSTSSTTNTNTNSPTQITKDVTTSNSFSSITEPKVSPTTITNP